MSARAAPELPGVELLDVIGTGGSGVVYRGRQVAFDRPVAVKVVSAGGTDSETRRRWEREVAAIGRLTNHPNVVPVFDAGTLDDGTSYLVMPLVPGGTLGDRLRHEGALDPAEVAGIGTMLAGALVAVHAAGVLHRDVKPDNVLCTAHGEAQLTDFGIARLQDVTATLTGSLQATVSYAAPEVLAGGEATEATDVYGLGATLYACLTGRAPHPPVPGEHLAASVRRALEDDPPPLAAAGVPGPLAAVVERAISRDPARRQPDAATLRLELQRATEALARPGPPGEVTDTQVLPAAPVHDVGATRVQPATSPAAAPSRRPARAPLATAGGPGGPGSRTLWLGVLAVVVLAVGLFVVAGMADDDGGGTATTETTAEPAEAATTAPTTESTEPPATTEEPTTTDAPTTTEEPAAPADEGASSEGAADAAVTYLRTLDADDLDEAWAMTTPRFQSQQDREQWEAFWLGHDVEIVGDPEVDGGTVTVPLLYDGQREDYRLDMVRQGGAWLVDGPVGR
ncbi:MAG TPA: serine/threonine-protein kinase [Acidimicrobiales bacterium]|nr:serine/threonine-protein kinase [Acidimicrobiales bacterium]